MRKVTLILILSMFAVAGFTQTPTFTDPQSGVNPKEVTAYQIEPITVDGDLSDWPAGLEKRVVEEFYPSYQVTTLDASTQDNWFMVAWNNEANQIYVAGWSEDDVNVTQLSQWNEGVIPADTWFYDRYEIYVEWDNDDYGAYGYNEGGNVQYAIVANDPNRTGGEYDTSQELDENGEILEDGTAFWVSNLTDVMLDGRPPFAEAKMVITPNDPNNPLGPYEKQFEMAFKLMNFMENGLDPIEDMDVEDLSPDMNDGRGVGFDVTMMDRDGDIASGVTVQGEGAWIGWSEGSKNGAPELDGTLFFSMEFAATAINSWELY